VDNKALRAQSVGEMSVSNFLLKAAIDDLGVPPHVMETVPAVTGLSTATYGAIWINIVPNRAQGDVQQSCASAVQARGFIHTETAFARTLYVL
jgi:hypothetical protein